MNRPGTENIFRTVNGLLHKNQLYEAVINPFFNDGTDIFENDDIELIEIFDDDDIEDIELEEIEEDNLFEGK